MKNNWLKLIFWVGVCLGVGFLGSLATTPAIEGWYVTLIKPSFNPPNWVFGPVWTSLFVLMGWAAYLVSREKGEQKRRALLMFGLQLGFNFLWSLVFFYFKRPDLAFGEILVLWFLIWETRKQFSRLSRVAGWLLFPYLIWVSFAAILNFSIAILN